MKIRINRLLSSVMLTIAVVLLSGCVSKDRLVLFQDADDYVDAKRIASTYDIRIQADDQLSIAIASQDKELVEVFNNKTVIGTGNLNYSSNTQATQMQQTFHVDNEGCIEFPVFGKIQVEGLSRKAIADTIQNRLRSGYINDAVVNVELLSFHVVVVGGVGKESILTIDKDRCTIVEALTMAGGFKSGGYRENVLVVREENSEIWTYRVNFTHMSELLNSPVYYLQQNDIIYVEPGNASQIDESPTYKYMTAISSIASFLVSISAILLAVFK